MPIEIRHRRRRIATTGSPLSVRSRIPRMISSTVVVVVANGTLSAPRSGSNRTRRAVYIDTSDAVEMAELPAGVEEPGYVDAWKTLSPLESASHALA